MRKTKAVPLTETERKLKSALEALEAMYALKGGMEKPREHKPTRDALRKAEVALYGTAFTD